MPVGGHLRLQTGDYNHPSSSSLFLDFPKQPVTEPYWCHKHGRICEPTTEAFKFLKRYSIDTIHRVKQYALVRTDAKVTVYHADSRTADFPPVDGVITSPPYVGLIDYHEQHAYAYHLLGLRDLRDCEIGAASNGASERAKQQYMVDIAMVEAVLAARRTDDLVPVRLVADLWVQRHDGTQLFFEIKSPVPNKGQCLEVTQRLLRVHLVTGQKRPQVAGYFAMAYNRPHSCVSPL